MILSHKVGQNAIKMYFRYESQDTNFNYSAIFYNEVRDIIKKIKIWFRMQNTNISLIVYISLIISFNVRLRFKLELLPSPERPRYVLFVIIINILLLIDNKVV